MEVSQPSVRVVEASLQTGLKSSQRAADHSELLRVWAELIDRKAIYFPESKPWPSESASQTKMDG